MARRTGRAALEAVRLVNGHNFGNGLKVTVDQNLVKKSCAAAVGGVAHNHGRDAWRLRGGRRSRCSRAALERSDFELRRVPLIFAWK